MQQKSHRTSVISATASALLGVLLAGLGPACGDDEVGGVTDSDAVTTNPGQICVPGHQVDCACPGGHHGIQVCEGDGQAYGGCECDAGTGTGDASGSGSESGSSMGIQDCGDGTCSPELDETCETCSADCGVCGMCLAAPGCEGVLIPGIIETHMPELDLHTMNYWSPGQLQTILAHQIETGDPAVRALAAALAEPSPDDDPLSARLRAALDAHPQQAARIRGALAAAGLERPEAYRARFPVERRALPPPQVRPEDPPTEGECDPPRLRMRIAKLLMHEESDDIADDVVYCAILSEAGTGAELRLLAPTPPLDEGDEHTYALSEGVIWGQDNDLIDPGGNMIVTYNCFEQDDVAGWQALLDAVGDAADGLGGLPGDLGWIFPTIGGLADIINAALAFESDDHLFNASQIIPKELHLEMTNGVWWGVRQSGEVALSQWDWELRVEAWGCADNGVAPDPG